MNSRGADVWMESLEGRRLLSFTWSSEEVYLLELVNRARANPAAEAIRTGVDLTADLTAGELANLEPSEPLALNGPLTLASRQHSFDMYNRDFFDHVNPDGDRAQERADANGYDGSAGENIAAGYDDIDEAHVAWLDSVGHRKNVLSLWESFSQNFHYDEIGVGFYFPGSSGSSTYHTYFTQVFGYSGRPPRTYILGVVYDDANSNEFYSIGEGRGSVRVDVTDIDSGVLVGSYTTDQAGNYQIEVDGGDYYVTFVDETTGLGRRVSTTVTTNTNVKIDALGAELIDQLAPSDNVAATGAAITGSAVGNGELTVTTLNNSGRPIAFFQDDGSWTVADLQTLAGTPTVSGQIQTFTDPRDGLTYAAATSDEGLLLFRRSAEGVWSYRNINTELSTAGLLEGDITVFVSKGNKVHIAGIDSNNDIHLFNQTGATGENGAVWVSRNLSDVDLRLDGKATPIFSSSLISFVTPWNALNIAGLDADGNIQAVWYHSSLSRWTVSNLSASTGAPPLTGGLTAYLTTWSAINLVGTDAEGNVSVTWWVPSFGPNWTTSNLTTLFDGPALRASSLASFVTPWGATNIAGLDADGNLSVYWWAPTSGGWNIATLSDVVEDAVLPVGKLSGLTVSSTGTINILGASADGEVLRYWWKPGGSWAMQNLTELT